MPGENPDWRTRNIGRLLLCAADAFVTDKLRAFDDGGFGRVSQMHISLIQNLDLGGTRLSSLAARARMTKQSMLELVDRAEAGGLVERRSDSDDRRAKSIALTPVGLQTMDRLKDGIDEAERTMAAAVGAGFLRRMKQKLTAYAGDGNGDSNGDGNIVTGGLAPEAGDATQRTRNAGRVLSLAFGVFTADVRRMLNESGFDGVSEVHMTLFRNLDMQGTRPTELARRARMTKQAMTSLVRRTESLGLVRQAPDPGDGRAKTIVLTPGGLRLLDRTRAGIDAAEQRMAAATGGAFFRELKGRLASYVAGAEASYLAASIGELAAAGAILGPPGSGRFPGDLRAADAGADTGRSPPSLRIMGAG